MLSYSTIPGLAKERRVKAFSSIYLAVTMIAALLLVAQPAAADPQIRTSIQCTKHFARAEREYGIPKHLLMAIAATESGRWHKKAGMALPWPWTVNAEGKGYYFDSKHEAVTAVRRMQQRGVKSIDIGCMQVNLKHHPDAFPSVSEAFSPMRNIAYSAKFLRSNYDKFHSWRKAAAAYHSQTKHLGHKYYKQVRKNWKRALELVGYGSSPYVRRPGGAEELAILAPEAGKARAAPKKKTAAKKRSRTKPRMKVVKVSPSPVRDKHPQVLVIRPGVKRTAPPTEVVIASHEARTANVTLTAATTPTSATMERAPQDNTTVQPPEPSPPITRSSSRKKGPNFIFD